MPKISCLRSVTNFRILAGDTCFPAAYFMDTEEVSTAAHCHMDSGKPPSSPGMNVTNPSRATQKEFRLGDLLTAFSRIQQIKAHYVDPSD